jgi:hypothetical protein
VWERFGDVDNYVEPFAGSLAVLLGRPTPPQTETVNDLDCYLANFWRATSIVPECVAEFADYPVNEADLHARHLWLVNQEEFRERMKTDPDFFDARIAGWWVWGLSQWIGSGWCSKPEWTRRANAGRVDRGIHRNSLSRQIPNMGDDGRGVHRKRANGVHGEAAHHALYEYFEALQARLRRVRVCCGEWSRVLGPSVTIKHGVCGVFLDPPYDMREVTGRSSKADALYSSHDNDLSADVRKWAIENGDNPLLRIALCGYDSEHSAMPDTWECVAWKAHGGYGLQSGDYQNAERERIWFSPHCLGGRQASLWG